MESQILQLPKSIYVNKQKLKKESTIYGILTLSCVLGFWYGTGKFFTADYYYPKMIIIMPICFVILLIETIKKYKAASNNDAILNLSEKGIEFFNKDYAGVGIVPWTEITSATELETGSSYFGSAKVKELCITVKTPSIYLDKMEKNLQKKMVKFNNKNNTQSIFNIETTVLDVDIIKFKKTIYQMIEKTNI